MSLSEWMVYRIEASLRLPCISHIYSAPLSLHFYYFQPEIVVRAKLSTLSEHSIENLYPLITSTVNYPLLSVVSTDFHFFQVTFCICIFVRPTLPSILLDPSVLGFIVNCRQCLVRQVTSQWFVTGRNTRRYTRPVIKTKRVLTKIGVRVPLLHP